MPSNSLGVNYCLHSNRLLLCIQNKVHVGLFAGKGQVTDVEPKDVARLY